MTFSTWGGGVGVKCVMFNEYLALYVCRRSTKNRRKAERKKHSLREGSANEDLALMEALGEIVSTVDRLQDEVASLLGILVQFGFMREGKDIQRTFEKLLGLVKSKIDEIWVPQRQEPSLSNLSITNIGVNNNLFCGILKLYVTLLHRTYQLDLVLL